MTSIHKGGRPPITRPEGFYEGVLKCYESMTIKQIADAYGVSKPTISRWLRIARSEVINGGEES